MMEIFATPVRVSFEIQKLILNFRTEPEIKWMEMEVSYASSAENLNENRFEKMFLHVGYRFLDDAFILYCLCTAVQYHDSKMWLSARFGSFIIFAN